MPEFRILVIRLSSMGDVIHTLPAAASLKHSFPHSSVSWIVRKRWTPLLQGNPFVNRVISVEGGLQGLIRSWRAARRECFDLVVDFQGLIQSALVAASVRSQKKVGLHRSQARESLASLFYSTAVLTREAHRVERNLELAAAAGATSLLRVFPLPEGEPEGDLPDGQFVLACPFAGWGAKQWPLEHFAEVARGLEIPLVLNGPPGSAASLARAGAHVHTSGLAGLIHATRRASAVIGLDSGPLHLAAALSKPGVAIYGPSDPAVHGPYGGTIRVLRAPDATTSQKRRSREDPSMLAIRPSQVLEALREALNSDGLKPSSSKHPTMRAGFTA
ncbi:MAG TPA: glycosyltransferase family 9 protein [Bryobacteraceae bacterium]|nr:glycosyltransferase family 9 protein [Bryobacteraceae bacterium]